MNDMPTLPHGPRLDPSRPRDLRVLVETGLIWGPAIPVEYKDMAIDALAEGSIEPNDLIPGDALAEVNRLRDAIGKDPIETGAMPEGDASA